MRRPFTNIHVLIAVRSLVFMAIRTESIVAIAAISNIDLGRDESGV